MEKRTPQPGLPVRGSKSGKPIMALFDLLGRSWAMGIIWQLADRTLTFRQVQDKCEIVSPTVLNKRLKELRECGLVQHGKGGYQLTKFGKTLLELLQPLGKWSELWADKLSEDK